MTRSRNVKLAVAAACLLALGGAAVAGDMVTRKDGKTIVDAPTTHVVADEHTGATRVKVRAPDTRIDVDTDRGHVRIRVPYFNGDIRW